MNKTTASLDQLANSFNSADSTGPTRQRDLPHTRPLLCFLSLVVTIAASACADMLRACQEGHQLAKR